MLKAYLRQSRALPVALLMALPLLVFYELGLLAVGWRALNGADLLTQSAMLHLGTRGFIIANLVLVVGFIAAVTWMRKRRAFDWRWFGPLALESGAYAAVLGSSILFVMQHARLLAAGGLLEGSGTLTGLVVSAGAGLHEELVFRLLLIPAVAAAWRLFPGIGGPGVATTAGVVVSSVLFSLAHFLAEPFAWFAFWYRALAGLAFAGIFATRGFAVAAWTHALYDIYVLVL